MREYPSTNNLYTRDPETHKLILGEIKVPEHAAIGSWLVTEKVDGTNIRVLLRLDGFQDTPDGSNAVRKMQVEVRGRSDRANVPGDLEAKILQEINARWQQVFAWLQDLTMDDDTIQVCIYGEGYGAGIQKVGKQYRADDKSLRIFDVTTNRVGFNGDVAIESGPLWWRNWETVENAATALGLPTVPKLMDGAPTDVITEFVASNPSSLVAWYDGGEGTWYDPEVGPTMEGVVARTDPYLYDWQGHRILFKLKGADLPVAVGS